VKTFNTLVLTGILLAVSNAAAPAAYAPEIAPIMRPVNAVLSAMNGHDAQALSASYATDVVIVDEQAPYHWSGRTAGNDWLSAISTWGKMRDAHFTAFADPMLILTGPGTAYGVVRGTVRGFGQRRSLRENGAMTFSLREKNASWKITNQSWTTL
jgi:ketosteroid isomerase-like protein